MAVMPPISDVKVTEDEPHDELTALCDRMTELLPDGIKAVIMLDAPNKRAGMVAHGYEDAYDVEIVKTIRRHLQALQQARLG